MIYFLEADVVHIKIGFTGGNAPDERMKALQTGSPVGLVLLLRRGRRWHWWRDKAR